MKRRLSDKHQAILLRRHADHAHRISTRTGDGIGRGAGEACAGLLMGIPLGVGVYAATLAVLLYPVAACVLFVGWGFAVTLHLSGASRQALLEGLWFGPGMVLLLAALASVLGLWFTRLVFRQGYRVFAWVQTPLMLLTLLALFYWTFLHHKPLLPFYRH